MTARLPLQAGTGVRTLRRVALRLRAGRWLHRRCLRRDAKSNDFQYLKGLRTHGFISMLLRST